MPDPLWTTPPPRQSGPLGGGFGNGGWETNTLVSDTTTVICLDDYHANDRAGRKVTGRTALEGAEQNFDLMYEQLKALKEGKTVAKPIYNHVNGCVSSRSVGLEGAMQS